MLRRAGVPPRQPLPLTTPLVKNLYRGCGVALSHSELLTGQPAMTVRGFMRRAGIPAAPPGGRTPFLYRWRAGPNAAWKPSRKHAVLLVRRTRDGLDDWVLPGGTPRDGESLTSCARRELLEETGLSADPSRVLLVVESAPPGAGRRLFDVVFLAAESVFGMEHSREPGLEPCFVPSGRLADLNLHPRRDI